MVTANLAAMALLASLAPGLMSVGARADDASCVSKAEYRKIKSGMSIPKLTVLLDGQVPFADLEAKNVQRVRWYAACDAWQPVRDVKIRYRKPVVGRKTVISKKLAVYVPPPTPTPAPGPKGGSKGGPKGGSGSPRPSR